MNGDMRCDQIAEINVLIYGARAAYSVKVAEQQKPVYVVFGIGTNKYQTAKIYGNPDPEWNEMEKFKIYSERVPLRITVFEKSSADTDDTILATFKIPVVTMPNEEESRELIARFASSEKLESVTATSKSKGYLIYESFVTKYRPPDLSAIEYARMKFYKFSDYLENELMPTINSQCIFSPFRKLYDNFTGLFKEPHPPSEPVVLGRLMESSFLVGAYLHHSFPTVQKVAVQKTDAGRTHLAVLKRNSRSSVELRIEAEEEPSQETYESSQTEDNEPEPTGFFGAFLNKLTQRQQISPQQIQHVKEALSRQRSMSHPDLHTLNEDSDHATSIIRHRKDTRSSGVFPVVKHLSPTSVSVFGGARLTINGKNLGLDANDVVGLYVCGSNCISTLQYESPEKIYCTTKAWRACQGTVTVITASGGRSLTDTKFSFVNLLPSLSEAGETASLTEQPDLGECTESDRDFKRSNYLLLHTVEDGCQTDLGRPTDGDDRLADFYHQTLEGENATLREVITDLEDEIKRMNSRNVRMQKYVDRLVSRVLREVPDALSIRAGLTTSESEFSP